MTETDKKTPSVYQRGALDGWRMGLYLSAMFLSSAYSMEVPVLGILSMILMLAVPVVAYLWLQRDYRRYPSMRFFSAIWMHGICIFFFASVVMALIVYIFLRFIEPGFIVDNVRQVIEIYKSMKIPEATEIARTLQQMIDKHLLPSNGSVALSMVWTVTFFGSMLSLILTFLVRLINRNRK